MATDPTNAPLTPGDTDTIVYRLVEPRDIDHACRIFIESFPHRIRRLFNREEHGRCFLSDLIQWYIHAYSQTFFTAQCNGQLVGYLILTMPHQRTWPNLFRQGWVFRVMAHALTGRYGFRFLGQVIKRLARSIIFISSTQPPRHTPHIPIVAVDNRYSGKGIGSHLMSQAMNACRPSPGKMWLNVETDNHQVILWYKHLGFQIIDTDPEQHMMLWHADTTGDQTKHDEHDSSVQNA